MALQELWWEAHQTENGSTFMPLIAIKPLIG